MTQRERKAKQQRLEERLKQRDTNSAAKLAVNALMVIPAYVLRTTYGFGNERTERFMTEFVRIWEAVCKGEVKVTTLAESLDAEIGIRFDSDGSIYNMRKDD
jgi:hypothetical protein